MSKTNTIQPSMKLVHGFFQNFPSFCLIPVTNDCPYVEVLYNPEKKILAIIGKTKKDKFHMVPRVNEDGDKVRRKSASEDGNPFKMQRVEQESYSEYFMMNEDDIVDFIKEFAINEKDFDYQNFLKMELMKDPSPILTGPEIEKGTPLIKV